MAKKYYFEYKKEEIVNDNGESYKDELFLEFKEERAMEGLSESPVQFMTQFFFMVFYVWLQQAEV